MPIPTPSGLIERPRVAARITEALNKPLVVLTAPMGSGKSSAMASTLRRLRAPVAWYTVAPWHRDRFIEPLAHAVREVREDFGRFTLALATAPPAADERVRGGRLGEAFCADLAHVHDPIVIVIDDAHVLGDDPLHAGFLEALVRMLPAHVTLAMVGRSVPSIALPELLAAGRAAAIDGNVLRFAPEDVDALAAARGYAIDSGQASALVEQTEGWAVAIALGLEAPLFPTAGGSRAALSAYLADAFVAKLPGELQSALESVAVFETIDLRLLEGDEAAWPAIRRSLRALEQRGAPLATLDGAHLFRIHPLLRQTILERIRSEHPESWIAAQHRRASALYEGAHMLPAALFHLEQAADVQALIAFFHRHADDSAASGEIEHVAAIVDRLRAQGHTDPIFDYVDGLLLRARGAGAEDAFARARDGADRAGLAALAFAARAKLVQLALGQLAAVRPEHLHDLEVRASALDGGAQALAAVLIAWSRAIAGDFEAARARITPYVDRGDIGAHFNAAILSAYTETALGDRAAAERILTRLLHLLEESDRVVLHALTLIWYARLSLLWGRTADALDYARAAQQVAKDLDLRSEEAALALALGDAAIHCGDIAAAREAIRLGRLRAKAAWYTADVVRSQAAESIIRARIAFLEGDATEALRLARVSAEGAGGIARVTAMTDACTFALLANGTLDRELYHQAAAETQAAAPRDAADALALCDAHALLRVLSSTDGTLAPPPLTLGSFEYLVAARPALDGDAAKAIKEAERGNEAPLKRVLERLTAQGPRFEAHLIAALARKPRAETPAAPRGAELTAREREVLALVADGLTNKEIAARLNLSPRTVETHVERILGKLEAGSRSRAIAIAMRSGLLLMSS